MMLKMWMLLIAMIPKVTMRIMMSMLMVAAGMLAIMMRVAMQITKMAMAATMMNTTVVLARVEPPRSGER